MSAATAVKCTIALMIAMFAIAGAIVVGLTVPHHPDSQVVHILRCTGKCMVMV